MCIFQIIFTPVTEKLFQVKQDSVTSKEEILRNLEIVFVLQVIKCPFAHVIIQVSQKRILVMDMKREFQADKCQKKF